MYKTTLAILATIVAVTTAFTAPPLRAGTKTSLVDKAPKEGRQPEVIVTKNALREFANWNDVWDGYGGGYGGYGMGGGMRLRR